MEQGKFWTANTLFFIQTFLKQDNIWLDVLSSNTPWQNMHST